MSDQLKPRKAGRGPGGNWKPGHRSTSLIAARTKAAGHEVVANRAAIKYGDPRPIKPQPRVGFHDLDYIRPPKRDSLDRSGESKLRGYAGPRFPRMLKGQDR